MKLFQFIKSIIRKFFSLFDDVPFETGDLVVTEQPKFSEEKVEKSPLLPEPELKIDPPVEDIPYAEPVETEERELTSEEAPVKKVVKKAKKAPAKKTTAKKTAAKKQLPRTRKTK
jgi:hypothetical protein